MGEATSELANEGLPNGAGMIGDPMGRGETIGAIFAYTGGIIRSPPGVSALKLDVLGGAITSPRAIASASLCATAALDGRPLFFPCVFGDPNFGETFDGFGAILVC